MPKEIFEYEQLEHAQKDLLLFSSMNAHEDKPVYLLVSGFGKFRIEYSLEAIAGQQERVLAKIAILEIAVNGDLFKRQSKFNLKGT